MFNSTIITDVQKRRFALFLHAGYGERWAAIELHNTVNQKEN